jgi:hypothetical protein
MKRTVIFMALFLIPALIRAQNGPVDALFDKYAGKDGFTTVYISKYMFDMFRSNEINEQEADDINQILGKLTAIKILTVEDPEFVGKGLNFYNEIMKELPREKYKELMVVKDKNSDVVFLAREENNSIAELLLIVGGEEVTDNVLISIQGQIDLNTISKLSKTLNIEGMESLEQIHQ